YALKEYREAFEGQFTRLNVQKSHLLAALTEDYQQYRKKRQLMPLLYHEGKYELKDVQKIYDSDLNYRSASFYPDRFTVQIENQGFSGRLTSVQNLQGDLEWAIDLPKEFKGLRDGRFPTSFSLEVNNYRKGREYEAIWTTVSDEGDEVKYYFYMQASRCVLLLPM
ncbi:MAG: hypothetical protein AAFR59_10010, partial [Bacteroidota bacterium]